MSTKTAGDDGTPVGDDKAERRARTGHARLVPTTAFAFMLPVVIFISDLVDAIDTHGKWFLFAA